MAYKAYVVKVEKIRPHNNADNLNIATFFGNDTCVDLYTKVGDIGVYFPEGGQLSEEFCNANNLCRKKDAEGNNIGGYLDEKKRNVKTIKLRGERSDGLYLPLSAFDYISEFNNDCVKVGDTIDVLFGHEICNKYIPARRKSMYWDPSKKSLKANIAPLFAEHADTEQLAYNLDKFKSGDFIEISLKMHGTSQRTGYLPVLKGYKRSFLDKIFGREGTPIYEWDYISGTRRTILENFDGGYYGDNAFREKHSKFFEGKLHKGETVYFEVCGFINEDTPIMAAANNKKVNDKDFVKKYGETTVFSYGCSLGESDFYVYRMTMTNEDGDVVEYTPDFIRYRCEQMGAKTVPVLWTGFIPEDYDPAEFIINKAEEYYDGPDPIGKTHVREGVVIRIVNRPKFTAFKHKNFFFKVLSGIIKDEMIADDNISEDILSEM